MASLALLRTGASVASTTYTAYLLFASPALRAILSRLFSPSDHPLRLFALAITVLLNAKSLPFIWHFRLFGTMLYHLYAQPTPLPKDALFRPVITSSMYSSLPDCDYNGHKSNSTYFADLDIARTQLISCLLRKGIRAASRKSKTTVDGRVVENNGTTLADTSAQNNVPPAKGAYMIALGGVSCQFKREIKPYERFEIWTRVLSWDRKWIYFVSHIVKAGAVKPADWALQPWKVPEGYTLGQDTTDEGTRKNFQTAILASSIAKYVVKKGRLTIPPEIVLQNSGLLPSRPTEAELKDATVGSASNDEPWTWEFVEKVRQHGLKLAESFGALDNLHAEFPVSVASVDGSVGDGKTLRTLGDFRDFCLSL